MREVFLTRGSKAGDPDQVIGTVKIEEGFEDWLSGLMLADVPVRVGAVLIREQSGKLWIQSFSIGPDV